MKRIEQNKPKHLMTIGVIGAALIDYQVRKTTTARQQLVELASAAITAGELDDQEQVVVGHVLAKVAARNQFGVMQRDY